MTTRDEEQPGPSRAALLRGRQVSGLLLLGGLLLAAALFRANWHQLFPLGWWHVW